MAAALVLIAFRYPRRACTRPQPGRARTDGGPQDDQVAHAGHLLPAPQPRRRPVRKRGRSSLERRRRGSRRGHEELQRDQERSGRSDRDLPRRERRCGGGRSGPGRAGRPVMRKVLVANRSEIALRVIRTCRELELATVAVYSDADRDALHVREADEAVSIGKPHARESYLNVDKLIAAARETGADAIHPGYGFLSESARFAEACAAAEVAFVGPSAEAIAAMGDKAAARRLAREAGVPVVPGGEASANGERVAEEIGYPLLVKAAAGGGGRGIRTVRDGDELQGALAVAA